MKIKPDINGESTINDIVEIIRSNNSEVEPSDGEQLEVELQRVEKRLRFGDVCLLLFGHAFIAVFILLSIKLFFPNMEVRHAASEVPVQYTNSSAEVRGGIYLGDRARLAGLPESKVEVELSSLSQKAAEHLLVQLLSQDKRLFTILLVFIGAVITTPLVEEFLYRGVLTGWLVDSANVHLAKLGLSAKKAKFISTEIAIICPALFFAMNHTGYKNDYSVDFLLVTIFVVTLANCITLVAGFFYLTQVRKFTYDQIGFRMDKFIFDVMVAVVVSICLIPPLLILTSVLRFMFPTLVIDPFPLFIFAVMLGAIFLTTRRLLPCVIIHAILNGISFATLMLL